MNDDNVNRIHAYYQLLLLLLPWFGMGNSAPRHAPSKPLSAKVMLINGSFLQFWKPVKAIHVLLDYPNHFLCPSRSLRFGHNFIPALLPDEELCLGDLYFLLPFQTFQSTDLPSAFLHLIDLGTPAFSSADARRITPTSRASSTISSPPATSAPFPSEETPNSLLQDAPSAQQRFSSIFRSPFSKLTVRKFRSSSSPYAPLLPVEEKPKRLQRSSKSFVFQRQDEPLLPSAKIREDKTYSMRSLRKCNSSCASSASLLAEEKPKSLQRSTKSFVFRLQHEPSHPIKICHTPELQKAYTNLTLRKCRSWKPRLQAINEAALSSNA